jgi:hypothetical protein
MTQSRGLKISMRDIYCIRNKVIIYGDRSFCVPKCFQRVSNSNIQIQVLVVKKNIKRDNVTNLDVYSCFCYILASYSVRI